MFFDRLIVVVLVIAAAIFSFALGVNVGVGSVDHRACESSCADRVEACSAEAGMLLQLVQRCARHERAVIEPCSP